MGLGYAQMQDVREGVDQKSAGAKTVEKHPRHVRDHAGRRSRDACDQQDRGTEQDAYDQAGSG